VQVPLYDTFGAEAVEFIIKHSNIEIIFCSSSKLMALTQVLPKVKEHVSQVVVWSSLPGVPVEQKLLEVCAAPHRPLHRRATPPAAGERTSHCKSRLRKRSRVGGNVQGRRRASMDACSGTTRAVRSCSFTGKGCLGSSGTQQAFPRCYGGAFGRRGGAATACSPERLCSVAGILYVLLESCIVVIPCKRDILL
jgi:hypothetical protein